MQPIVIAEKGGVAAVDRAFTILSCFGPEDEGLTLAELADRTGLYKSTILRLAESLTKHGYLQRLEDGRFQIGPAPFALGAIYQRSLKLGNIVPPLLRELAELTTEGVSFYTRQGSARVCLFRVDSQHPIRQHEHEGDVLPLDVGSSGRVLNAFSGAEGPIYDKIRQACYYISIGERDRELAGISAPVFGAQGRLVGALTLGGPLTRVDVSFLEKTRAPLLDAAIRATTALGGNPSPLAAAAAKISKRSAGRAGA